MCTFALVTTRTEGLEQLFIEMYNGIEAVMDKLGGAAGYFFPRLTGWTASDGLTDLLEREAAGWKKLNANLTPRSTERATSPSGNIDQSK